MITWMKEKYRAPKTKGRYKSASNQQGTKHALKRKLSEAQKIQVRASQPTCTLVLNARGQTRIHCTDGGR